MNATGNGEVVLTGGGYVVRELSAAVPYSRMTPVRTYRHRTHAERLSDKLTYGE